MCFIGNLAEFLPVEECWWKGA